MNTCRTITACGLALLLAGCVQPLARTEITPPIDARPAQRATPPTFVEVRTREDHKLLKQKVKKTNLPETTLMEAVYAPIPYYITVEAGDDQVDLARPVSVRADKHLSVKDYLTYLAGLTGYHYELLPDRKTVRVSSRITRAWNLSTLASAGDTEISVGGSVGGGGGDDSGDNNTASDETGAEIKRSFSAADPWTTVLNEANCIMETSACGAAGDGESRSAGRAPDGSWVAANRQTGKIQATGPSQKIAQLDRWLSPLQKSAARFVRLDVAIFEVVLDAGRGRSVDLRALNEGINRTANLTGISNEDNRRVRYAGNVVGEALDNAGSFVFGATAKVGDLAFDLVLRQLRTEGEVTLLNRASLITPNGETATIRSIESFFFIDGQEVIPGDSNNQQRISTTLARESVGLEIGITPQYLDARRLSISIVPSLSALSRFDNVSSGDVLISEAPRTTLTTLSSRGVTESGRPIALGGLASESFQLRVTDVGLGGTPVVGKLLDSGSRIHQRRQLIVLVVPHEVSV